MTTRTPTITVAAAQLPARPLSQAAQALSDIQQAVAAASRAGADLVVLPECCYPAYWLGSRDLYTRADILRGQAVEAVFSDLARRHGIAIVAGIVYEQDAVLHDAAIFLDKSGRLAGRHFKTFLWDAEHDWYQPGTRVQPVDTDLGRIGMVVCAEGRSPEVFASHAAQDSGLLAMPTAWVNAAADCGQYYNPQPDFLIPARAAEFGLPIVCANKFGQESDQVRFCGMSLIVSAEGEVLAAAPPDAAALLLARVRVQPKRLILPEATVRTLLDSRPPVLPPADAEPLRVALLGANLAGRTPDEVSAMLAGQNIQMVLRPTRGAEHSIVEPYRRVPSQRQTVAHARVGFLTAGQARSFVWPRILALDGAQVLCVTGPLGDLPALRTRAVENRIIVLAAPEDRPVAIAPNGAVIAQSPAADDQPLIVDLPLADAAAKLVAPQTHIWRERRCEAYCLRSQSKP